jgi:hypothetical protein
MHHDGKRKPQQRDRGARRPDPVVDQGAMYERVSAGCRADAWPTAMRRYAPALTAVAALTSLPCPCCSCCSWHVRSSLPGGGDAAAVDAALHSWEPARHKRSDQRVSSVGKPFPPWLRRHHTLESMVTGYPHWDQRIPKNRTHLQEPVSRRMRRREPAPNPGRRGFRAFRRESARRGKVTALVRKRLRFCVRAWARLHVAATVSSAALRPVTRPRRAPCPDGSADRHRPAPATVARWPA